MKSTWNKSSGRLVMRAEKDDKTVQSTWTKGIQAAIRWQGDQLIVRQLQCRGARAWVSEKGIANNHPAMAEIHST